jgi:hypothetical protein
VEDEEDEELEEDEEEAQEEDEEPVDMEAGIIPDSQPSTPVDNLPPTLFEEYFLNDYPVRNVGIIVRNVIIGTLALGGAIGLSQKYLMIKSIGGNSIDSW